MKIMKNSLLFISIFMLLMACQENTSTNKSIDKEHTEKIVKMKKVLFILTSHDELGDTGKKTGFWIEEFASPYYFLKDKGLDKNEAFQQFYMSTGRALLFNLMALVFGFGLLMTSSVTTLIDFGLLLVVAVLASFLSSLILLPAMIYLTNPKFVGLDRGTKSKTTQPEAITTH